jgi:hypothetical protein
MSTYTTLGKFLATLPMVALVDLVGGCGAMAAYSPKQIICRV